MTLRRKIIGNKSEATLWVAAVALLIIFQTSITAYAQANMAAWSANSASVICSIHSAPIVETDAPLKNLAKSCCSVFCQAACAIGIAFNNQTGNFFDFPVFQANSYSLSLSVRGPPDHIHESPRLRGPPSLSV